MTSANHTSDFVPSYPTESKLHLLESLLDRELILVVTKRGESTIDVILLHPNIYNDRLHNDAVVSVL